jgi:hypothetical protein
MLRESGSKGCDGAKWQVRREEGEEGKLSG